jgi:hypothetical protein
MLEENWEIAATIDERVRQLTREAVSDTVLVNRMLGYLINSTAAIARKWFFLAFWSPRPSRRSIDVD